MKKNIIILILLLTLLSCSEKYHFIYKKSNRNTINVNRIYPKVNFITISDLHFYDKSLGISGNAFQKYLEGDRKLLIESEEILDTVFNQIINGKIKPDFLIITGDLTKDGERINHEKVKSKLEVLKLNGIKVFVINGNHDINNSDANKYDGDKTESIDTLTKKDFLDIYNDFGFSDAIEKDKYSLSYVVEPSNGLWVLMMDAGLYEKNIKGKEPIVEGEFKPETGLWIEQMLIKAEENNKIVIGVMHQGILEHYKSNRKYFPDYVVNNNIEMAKMFAHYRLNIVLTGHFHAQDITLKKFDNNFLYDIETGSLVTYPCPYRLFSLTTDGILNISSNIITSIPSHPNDFQLYEKEYVISGTMKKAVKRLKEFKINENDAAKLSYQIANAYAIHLAGDEITPKIIINTEGLGLWSKIAMNFQKDLVSGWLNDLPPKDNSIIIDLKTGLYK